MNRLFLPLLLLVLAQCTSTRPAETPLPPRTVEVGGPAPADVVEAPVEEDVAEAEELAQDWHLQNGTGDYPGIGVEAAYQAAPTRTPTPIVVAVIDSGVDIAHEDLQGRLWTNEDEIAGNGVDDDANGYVDDVHGWSFLGNAQGENLAHDTYEVTREYARLRTRYENVRLDALTEAQKAEYAYFEKVRADYQQRRQDARQALPQIEQIYTMGQQLVPRLQQHLGKENITEADLRTIGDADAELARARDFYNFLLVNGIALDDLKAYRDQLSSQVNYHFNAEYDGRKVVGDDPSNPNERQYGNPDVTGPEADHGTHVAGIIAARRDNALGAAGVADAVRIMPVRAVPDGDERDKDVANAIRYAADNGARIINMSFGKGYSPHKAVVDEAVRYAVEKGVLLVHGSGNDGADSDVEPNFPSPHYLDGGAAATWLTVGASSWEVEDLAAPFSNYGQERVDLFAPGVDIFSTLPGSKYGPNSGTSMAAPVVSGVAALVLSYYPELTAAQLRQVLLDSARRYPGEQVMQPGGEEEVDFCTLSVTCGVVDAAAAMARAAQVVNAGGR